MSYSSTSIFSFHPSRPALSPFSSRASLMSFSLSLSLFPFRSHTLAHPILLFSRVHQPPSLSPLHPSPHSPPLLSPFFLPFSAPYLSFLFSSRLTRFFFLTPVVTPLTLPRDGRKNGGPFPSPPSLAREQDRIRWDVSVCYDGIFFPGWNSAC